MFVFYDWPLPHVYFAKNVAYFPFLGSVFSDCVVFYGDNIYNCTQLELVTVLYRVYF